MQVIEAQCASILEPHDHLHIKHDRAFPHRLDDAYLYKLADRRAIKAEAVADGCQAGPARLR